MITPELSRLREQIEQIDSSLVELIANRVRLAREVGIEKRAAGLPALDPKREAAVVRKAVVLAREAGLEFDDEIRQVFWLLIGLSRRAQARDQ
ncbi:MAG TPA: chorismate mutase [Gemmatimonadaceae bacterium]|nr:chorismate mutase [Gemmatimonadaceae bacterium]